MINPIEELPKHELNSNEEQAQSPEEEKETI